MQTAPTTTAGERHQDIPEVSPEIDNLPGAEPNQHAHGAKGEPLHALIGALVGIPQLLLARPEVFHLADNLLHHLLDTAEVGLDGLELLLALDAGPITRVGANVDVELDRPVRVGNSFCSPR